MKIFKKFKVMRMGDYFTIEGRGRITLMTLEKITVHCKPIKTYGLAEKFAQRVAIAGDHIGWLYQLEYTTQMSYTDMYKIFGGMAKTRFLVIMISEDMWASDMNDGGAWMKTFPKLLPRYVSVPR